MLTRRQTIRLWLLTSAGFLVWTIGGWLLFQDQPNGSPVVELFAMAAMAILLFGIWLTFSILFSTLFHLFFVGTRADDEIRKHGHILYYLFWKELQDHIDNLRKP